MTCAGCFSQARALRVVETPDPAVGDLRCAAPRISVLEALYAEPGTLATAQCEPRD